ncbi:hypothetical protein CMK11_14270 [Candidatus Poribacteria bacterium]|nr:hypothetical protein [Candidatus Poribacteria bacterium]
MSSDPPRCPIPADDALVARNQLMRDGYCIVPGVLQGDFLERVRAFADRFLDEHPVDHKHRYQGSDFHILGESRWQANPDERRYHAPIVDELVDFPEQRAVAEAIGLEGLDSGGGIIILNKPPQGPPLYWHQDCMHWNHPRSALPWPTQVFMSYYLVDTTRENGCLRALPGTHLRRTALHDILPPAHGPEIQAVEVDHPGFAEHPDEVDIMAKAGDLVFADARVLHAAWPNQTDVRRPLVLQWWSVFPFPTAPSWWEGDMPAELSLDPDGSYDPTRVPGEHLKASRSAPSS